MLPVQGPSPTEIKAVVQYLVKKWQLHRGEKRFSLAVEGRNNSRLMEVLETLYEGHKFLQFDNNTFPIIHFPIPTAQMDRPESILGVLDSGKTAHVDRSLYRGGKKYLELLLQAGRPLTNLTTYCLDRIIFGEELRINCIFGNYFETLTSCDILEWELLTEIDRVKTSGNIGEFVANNLRLRNYVHERCKYEDPILCPKGRSAALSISTLVLFNRGTDYAVLIGERSIQGVAVHGDLYHVVPSGMFQPIVGDWLNEFSVTHCFFREYLEELFGMVEVKTPPSAISYDYFYNDNNLKFLRRMLRDGDAQMFLTGFVINALNLRPEICTMLFIKTPNWFIAHKKGSSKISRIELNEEWKKPTEKSLGKPNVVSVSDVANFGLHPGNVVPPGAAAIILGLQAATSLKLLEH
jgi:hypothetical protein